MKNFLAMAGAFFIVLNLLSVNGQPQQKRKPSSSPTTAQRGLDVARSEAASQDYSEKRVALVIGNSSYQIGPLRNPVNDARDLAKALREVGFVVIEGENLNKREMADRISVFGSKIKGDGVGLFYFSGHGVQLKDKNYLIPVGANIQREQDVEFEAVEVNRVLNEMGEAGNRLNIIILDACRNNPFTRSSRSASQGLAQMDAPTGTIISYATGPGQTASDNQEGKNGLYTQELLNNIKIPGLKIEDVFKRVRMAVGGKSQRLQIPWESSSLTGDFYFQLNGDTSNPIANSTLKDPVEIEFWTSIKTSKNSEDFRAYIEKYPNGNFVGLAKNQIKSLENPLQPQPSLTPPNNVASPGKKLAPGRQPKPSPEIDKAQSSNRVVTEKPLQQPGQLKLRIRTSVPNCDMIINGKEEGNSNDQGLFEYVTGSPALLIEVRKEGYLGFTKRINDVTAVAANGEILLMLEPTKGSITISGNIEGAYVQLDDQNKLCNLNERISAGPGLHKITVNALGFAPTFFDVTLDPGKDVNKTVTLEKLPISELAAEAERRYNSHAYSDVLLLCKYIFEGNAGYGPAHRLAGLAYLAAPNYTKAEYHFGQALAANENIKFRVRRHARESFDKGHGACEAYLILSKDQVEFQGIQVSTENFRVAYSQLPVSGIQLQKNSFVYLSTKHIDSSGNKRDFNFYSCDNELSQSGKGYLEMIQHLLKPH